MVTATVAILDNRDGVVNGHISRTAPTKSEAAHLAFKAAELSCVTNNAYEGQMRFVALSATLTERLLKGYSY